MKRIFAFFLIFSMIFCIFGCQKKVPNIEPERIEELKNQLETERNNQDTAEELPLSSKTVVCMGDSLFGMHRDETSTPNVIAKNTGATVYNAGFGGTRLSVHPYKGFDAFSAFKLVDAVISRDFSEQEAQAAYGEDYFPEQLEVLKSIDFSTVDIIVLHYGTNDFNGKYVPFENPDDPKDTNTILGALNYCIDALEEAFPHIEIVVSLPVYRMWYAEDNTIEYGETRTDSFGNVLTDLISEMQKTADAKFVYTIDSYSALEISKDNASDYLPDGTHFNEEGRRLFGEYISQCLIEEYA